MLVDINFIEKTQSTTLTFNIDSFTDSLSFKNALGIIAVISSDYYLDPEIDEEALREFIKMAQDQKKDKLSFEVSEEGLELELK